MLSTMNQIHTMGKLSLGLGRFFVFAVLFLAILVSGDCECGYSTTIASMESTFLFTDVIESDFLHIDNITLDTDWVPQSFSMTPQVARGPFGMNYTVQSLISNPILEANNWTGPGKLGGDPGLQLIVSGGIPLDGYVNTAELDSARTDLLWGSYRASLKLTPISGTCSAFFWYFNDSQEIDMEILSSEFNYQNGTFPVNLVLQSARSVQAGFNAQAAGNYIVANLPFNPTTGYHEYRIDFIPEHVFFYADGQHLGTMNTTDVPTSPGHLILTHWSNGNILWSAGPPIANATMSVGYVKAYFNSSLASRHSDWNLRCKDAAAPGAVCVIPDQITPPDPTIITTGNDSAASTYFFSNHMNQTVNQTVYHKSHAAVNTLNWFVRSDLMVMLLAYVIVFL